jgi:hypothetical protein
VKVVADVDPGAFERKVLTFVVAQMLLITIVLSAIITFFVLYLKQHFIFIILGATVSLLLSSLMFRTYLLTNYRVLGALAIINDTFGGGTRSNISMVFPKPAFLFLRQSLEESVEKQDTRIATAMQAIGMKVEDYAYAMKLESPKYKARADCLVTASSGYKKYTLHLSAVDWNGQTHAQSLSGNMASIGRETKRMCLQLEQRILAGMA